MYCMRSATSYFRAGLLGALVLQTTVQSLAARQFRKAAEATDCGLAVAMSVVAIEVLKAVCSLVLLGFLEVRGGLRATLEVFGAQTVDNAGDALLICIPAACYVVSNTLNLTAASFVDGPLLLVFGTSQTLFVSLFSVGLLGRKLATRQWLALCVLVTSVISVQLERRRSSALHANNVALGLAAAATASAVSAFAGVFFELVLKRSAMSVWVRNVHLALASLPFALAALDRSRIGRCGFFAGYSEPAALTFVLVKVTGGLLVATVIKYADNILKCFAAATSVFVVSFAATFYDFIITPSYFGGLAGVAFAIILYDGEALCHFTSRRSKRGVSRLRATSVIG